MSIRRGIVVSDIHAGSFYGMLPPNFETSDGIVMPQNPGQEYLWRCWDDFTNRSQHYNPDFVIHLGDATEGMARKDGGLGLTLRAMVDQKCAAVETLKLLAARIGPQAKWYFVQGSEYHVGERGEYEEDVAKELNAVKYFSIGSGILVREVLYLDVDGVLIEAFHEITPTAGFYRATALDREMQWAAMSAKDASLGIPKVDLHIRAHVHHIVALEHASKQGMINPCWQLQTRFMRKRPRSMHRMHPNIGGTFLDIDPDAKKRGEAPCHIRKQLYSLPPMPIARL